MIKHSFLILCILVLSFVSILFINGCSNSNDMDKSYEASYDGAEPEMYNEAEYDTGFVANRAGQVDDYDSVEETSTSQLDVETLEPRMVIYHADMSLEVKDYHKSQEQIQEHVKKLGGFVVESSLYHKGNNEISGSLVVRLPQDKFYSFLNELESSSSKVVERSIRGNDVTEEYVDLNSRLRSKEVVEKRLLSFMEEARNTEDLLKISRDLGTAQEEIERIKGRMRYLENYVAFSTVSIYLQEKNITVPPIQEGEALDTWKKAQSLFMDTLNTIIMFFSSLVVFVIGLSPIIVPTLIIIMIVINVHKRKKRNISSD